MVKVRVFKLVIFLNIKYLVLMNSFVSISIVNELVINTLLESTF